MKKFMKKVAKSFHTGEKGFTLIELLIVIVILGVLAAVIIPNLSGFTISGRIAAGNTEVAAIGTAEQAYFAEHGAYTTTANLVTAHLLNAAPRYAYTIDTATGVVTGTDGASTVADSDGLKWNATTHQWERK